MYERNCPWRSSSFLSGQFAVGRATAVDSYSLNHLFHHLYRSGESAQLIGLIEEGFLDYKLAQNGPAALLTDFDYAFRACDDSANTPDFIRRGLRRSMIASRAALLDAKVAFSLGQLARGSAERYWMDFCVSLAEVVPSVAKRIAVLAALTPTVGREDFERIARRIKENSVGLRLDLMSSIQFGDTLKRLTQSGASGLDLYIEYLLPVTQASEPKLFRSGDLKEIAGAIGALTKDEGLQLWAKLMKLQGSPDKPETAAFYLSAAADYFNWGDIPTATSILDYLASTASTDLTSNQEHKWSHMLEIVELYAKFGTDITSEKAAQLAQTLLRDVQRAGTPFSSFRTLVRVLAVPSIRRDRRSSIEVLNEAAIAAYRPHDDYSAMMHPDPSDRCRALCEIAIRAHESREPEIASRLFQQATLLAEKNTRKGQLVTELGHIATTMTKTDRVEEGLSLYRRSMDLLAEVQDVQPLLRKGIEHDEALRRLVQYVPAFARSQGGQTLFEELHRKVHDMKHRTVRQDVLISLAVASLAFDDVRVVADMIDTVMSDIDQTASPDEKDRSMQRLAKAALDSATDNKRVVLRRLKEYLMQIESHGRFVSLFDDAVDLAQSLQDIESIDVLLKEMSSRRLRAQGQAEHVLLIPLLKVAAELGRFPLCNAAASALFQHAVLSTPEDKITCCRLAAKAYASIGRSRDAEAILVKAGRYADEIDDAASQAETRGRIAENWMFLNDQNRATAEAAKAIATMKELAGRTHGHMPWHTIAAACARIANRDRSRLLIDAVNTLVSSGDFLSMESALVAFAKACEDLEDTSMGDRLLDSFEHYANRLLEGNPTAVATLPPFLLAPIQAARAVVKYRRNAREDATRALNRALDIVEEFLAGEVPRDKGTFATRGLEAACRACEKLSEWSMTRVIMERVDSLSQRPLSPDRIGRMPHFEQFTIRCTVANAWFALGETDKALGIAEALHAQATSQDMDVFWTSHVLGELFILLLKLERGPRLHLLQRLEGESLEKLAVEVGQEAARFSASDAGTVSHALLRSACRFEAVRYTKVVLSIFPLLAHSVHDEDLRRIASRVLDAVAVSVDNGLN
jgi:tetratricopeptide (TPR) repeat protein